MTRRIAIALGGNALLERGQAPDVETQRANVERAAAALRPVAVAHDVIVTHGNGPQVGLLALQAEAFEEASPTPLDVLGAESEGMIGYLVERALRDELPGREIVTLLTQVEVDADDPAFRHPTKPIGPIYDEARARALAQERGFALAPDGAGLRRVVPSPLPRRVLELATIARLLEAHVLVICAGGGGIPVARGPDGRLRGVEAVVDKDRTSALLAAEVGADTLVLLTDVAAVFRDWPNTREPIRDTTPAELRGHSFAPGSMGPKVAAACHFAEVTGGLAVIGALADCAALVAGQVGTRVRVGR